MSEPTTQAGKRLLGDLPARYYHMAFDPVSEELTCDAILAIEAEARADLAARIETRVAAMTYAEGAPSDLGAESYFSAEGFDWCKKRVLAAIREEADR